MSWLSCEIQSALHVVAMYFFLALGDLGHLKQLSNLSDLLEVVVTGYRLWTGTKLLSL